MYKIISIKENSDKESSLSQISGYCILVLLCNLLNNNNDNLNSIINRVFSDYDYDVSHTRESNDQYIEYAKEYQKKLMGDNNV